MNDYATMRKKITQNSKLATLNNKRLSTNKLGVIERRIRQRVRHSPGFEMRSACFTRLGKV